MGEIETGSGLSEATTQMGEAANAAEAARRRGDKKEEAKQNDRFKNAEAASKRYKARKYG
ncbi:hypothetical protein ACFQ6C_26570 [Streptomyces sp. NPDC056454]|uniref:hypothetical protein n=1 Tax=Streptomyces sp. NPDC056454 TaxID=3345823 RepID=UPI0036B3AC7B